MRPAAHGTHMAQEAPRPSVRLSIFQLLTDQARHGRAGFARGFLQPREKFIVKANC